MSTQAPDRTILSLAGLTGIALVAAQACGDDGTGGSPAVICLSDLTFHLQNIRKMQDSDLSRVGGPESEYLVDIKDGNEIIGYGPEATEGATTSSVLFRGKAYKSTAENKLHNHDLLPGHSENQGSSQIIREATLDSLVSKDVYWHFETEVLALLIEHIIKFGLNGQDFHQDKIKSLSFQFQRLYVSNLTALRSHLARATQDKIVRLRLDLDAENSAQSSVSARLYAVNTLADDSLAWSGIINMSFTNPSSDPAAVRLCPSSIEWVQVDDISGIKDLSKDQSAGVQRRSGRHLLLVNVSDARGASENLHDLMSEFVANSGIHGLQVSHETVKVPTGADAVAFQSNEIQTSAGVQALTLLAGTGEQDEVDWCHAYISSYMATRDVETLVFVTEGLYAVTGHEASQVSVDRLGVTYLMGLLANQDIKAGRQVKVQQIDLDARSATAVNAQSLHHLVGQLLQRGEDEKSSNKSIFPDIAALRADSKIFKPFWVKSGRVFESPRADESSLAPFPDFSAQVHPSAMKDLLEEACTQAVRSIVDPRIFQEASKALDILAKRSLTEAAASLSEEEKGQSMPPHLEQLYLLYNQKDLRASTAGLDPQTYQPDIEELHTKCPPLSASLSLLSNVVGQHREIFLGKLTPLQALFSKKNQRKTNGQAVTGGAADVYDEGVLAQVHKSVVQAVVSRLCSFAVQRKRHLRILEIGAGTGGTALPVLRLLEGQYPGVCTEYAFTDLGTHFVNAFGRRYQSEYSFLRTAPLDIAKDPRQQGFASAEYDIVICVNVLHATPNLATTLSNAQLLLAPGGVLVLQEITTQSSAFLDATFGLTEGWWAVSATDQFRPKGYPTLDPVAWGQALQAVGFEWSASTPTNAEMALDQQAVFVAQKNLSPDNVLYAGEELDSTPPNLPQRPITPPLERCYVILGAGPMAVLAADVIMETSGVRQLVWVRPRSNDSHDRPQSEDETRLLELARKLQVRVSLVEADLDVFQISSLLSDSEIESSNVRGVIWVPEENQNPRALFASCYNLHVALDILDKPPEYFAILLTGNCSSKSQEHWTSYGAIDSFVRYRRNRLGLQTVLALWPANATHADIPTHLARSTVSSILRSCVPRTPRVAVFDFVDSWKDLTKTKSHHDTSVQKHISQSFPSQDQVPAASQVSSPLNNEKTSSVLVPRKTEIESNVPSLDYILRSVISEAEALLSSSQSIQPDEPLMMAGIDSLAVVELREALVRIFPAAPLPSTYIYEYPTSKAISEEVHALLLEAEQQEQQLPKLSPPLSTPGTALLATATSPKAQGIPHTSTQETNCNDRRIAVIAMECRMPGGMNSSAQFWDGLKMGRDAMTDIPLSRFDVDSVYHGDVSSIPRGKTYVRRGGFLERAEHFDAARFNVPEAQLEQMDPQQRILLEVVDDALQSAGYSRGDVLGKDASVYIGVSSKDWAKVAPQDGAFLGTGIAGSIVSNRISFELGLGGTSMSIDTACSSSLVAVDLAVQALRQGTTEMAIAGGVNMNLHPDPYIILCQSRMLSPEGVCKTLDRDANGYVRSEGCGVVLLKRLADAMRDGDPILGVITGSYSNQDGRSTNISAPSGKAQQALVRRALENAHRRPDEIDYVEMHGTGTALGDPVEVHSLKAVFGNSPSARVDRKFPGAQSRPESQAHPRQRPLWLGAVKTNIGHGEPVAGIAGLIKCLWIVNQRQVPPNVHLQNINPAIDFSGFEMARLPQQVEPLEKRPNEPVVAGCSSFGFGGTNVHIVVESPPAHQPRVSAQKGLIATSQKREEKVATGIHVKHATSCVGVSNKLQRPAQKTKTETLVFAFTGQGSQFAGMAQQLYGKDQAFTFAIEECLEKASAWVSSSDLRKVLLEPSATISPTVMSQPSLFVVEYAIYRSLQARVLTADVVMGHSIGEIAAAVAAGCLTLDQGLELVCNRAVAMEEPAGEVSPPKGTMYAIMLPHTTIRQHIEALRLQDTLAVAAVNGYNLTTVSGSELSMNKLIRGLGSSVTSTPLSVTKPFHSPLMASCMPIFKSRIGSIDSRPPGKSKAPRFWSTVTAKELSEAPGPDYWERHALQAVLFEPAVRSVSEAFAGKIRVLEIGPKPVLSGLMARWARMPKEAPPPCALLGCVSVASKSALDPATLQAALHANHGHVGRGEESGDAPVSAEYLDLGVLSRDLLLQDTNISVVGEISKLDRRRQGFYPWRRGYHAFMTEPRVSKLDRRTYAVTFRANHRMISLVADHVVKGRPIMPGAGIFDMALGAVQVVKQLHPVEALPIELHNAEITRPIVLAADMEPPWLRVTYNSADGRVVVQSAIDDDSEFIEHATGTVIGAGSPGDDGPAKATARHLVVDLEAVRSRCNSPVDIAAIRAQLAARGLRYGPQFQALTEAYGGEGECLGTLQLPDSGSSGYLVHPGLFDSAMQSCSVTVGQMTGKDAFAVGGIGRLRIFAYMGEHRKGATVKVWSRIVTSTDSPPDKSRYEANVDVCDNNGNLLFSIDRLVLVKINSQRLGAAARSCLYATEWLPLQPSSGQSLSLASRDQDHETFSVEMDHLVGIVSLSRARSRGRRGPAAEFGAGLTRLLGNHLVDVDTNTQPLQGLETSQALETGDKNMVLQTLVVLGDPTDSAINTASNLTNVFKMLHAAASSSSDVFSNLSTVAVVSFGSQAVVRDGGDGDDGSTGVESSAVWGLVRSARLEFPQLRIVTLDVDPTETAFEQALHLIDAVLDSSEDEVVWRSGSRYVPRLTDMGLDVNADQGCVRLDVLRPALDSSLDEILPRGADLNTMVPVDVSDVELTRIRKGYALANALALDSLVQGAKSVTETDVMPSRKQLWQRYAKAKFDRNSYVAEIQLPPVDCDDTELAAWMDEALGSHPEVAPEMNILRHVYRQHGAVFRGDKDPLELLFRTSQHAETAGVYSESFYARYYNTVVTHAFCLFVEKWRADSDEGWGRDRPLRVLEVGAGSGSTSRRLLQTAASLGIKIDYHFTDISETFLRKASSDKSLTTLCPGANLTFGVFDAECDPRAQGLGSASFDIAVGVNCIHATKNLVETMRNVRQLLKPRGIVILSEIVEPGPISDATFAMTDGWWRFEDKDLRPDYPLMSPANWERLLLATGFDSVRSLENAKAGTAQAVIVAQASCTPAPVSSLGHNDEARLAQAEQDESQQGVYVITGGTGGLGLLTAIVLLENLHCSKVYLLSRSGNVSSNSAHVWERLEALAQPGQIVKVSCDVSSATQVANVFDSIYEGGEWVRGIVHSAGVLRDAMLQNQTRTSITPVFGAKVDALRHLHSCSLDEPRLRHFVIFSSASALLGSPGQSNHSSANTFLDAFAAHRRAQGLPALSLQWGTVMGLGEAARKGANKLALKFGHGQVSESTAEAVLRAVFASNHQLTPAHPLTVSPFDWDTFVKSRTKAPHITRAFAKLKTGAPQLGANAHTKAPAKADDRSSARPNLPGKGASGRGARKTSSDVTEMIQACVEATINKRIPDESTTFLDAGVDSLSAIEFRNRLQLQFGPKAKLDASLVFDYPTLERLREYLQSTPGLQDQDEDDDDSNSDDEASSPSLSGSSVRPKKVNTNKVQESSSAPGHDTVPLSPKKPEPKFQAQLLVNPPKPEITVVHRNSEQPAMLNDRAISVVGMDCRLPAAGSIEELWSLLLTGEDPFRDIPFTRWDLDQDFYFPRHDKTDNTRRSYVKQGAFLSPDQLEWFDNKFFNISDAEARSMDPNQRLLLEVSYQALADAGYTRESLRGKNVGLFVGFMNYDAFFLADKGSAGAFTASSASPAVLSNRVSHVLGLEGPSCTIDTACSASLYALHMAIGALRSNQCDAAVVAGVNVMMSPAAFVAECAAGMLSPTARCRSLGTDADGFARGEGCSAIVIERRTDATAQGKHIYANILGSAVGHDGTTANLTSPNGPAQTRVIRRALQDAEASPSSISFVEGHLTGTVLGDPIEFKALKNVFGGAASQRDRSAPLHLGALKSNMGHLEGVAGIAGLVKTILSLRHRQMPPIAHLTKLNPHLDMDDFMVKVPTSTCTIAPSSPSCSALRGGVSSFGFSGANAHVVLEAHSQAAGTQKLVVGRKHAFTRNHFPLQRPGWRHALLGSVHDQLPDQESVRVPIGYRLFALLEQHSVKQVPTVPGAMLVELAVAIAMFSGSPTGHSASRSRSAVLEQIVFATPLTVDAPRMKAMVISYNSDGQFTVSSTHETEDQPGESPSDQHESTGLVTAYGQTRPCNSEEDPSLPAKSLQYLLPRYQQACTDPVDVQSLWDSLEAMGIRYSGHFRSLQRGYTSAPDRVNPKAVGYISLAENGEDGYITHPAILDSAMQLCAALVLSTLKAKSEMTPSRTFLPFCMKGVRVWSPQPRESRYRDFTTFADLLSVEEAEIKAKLSIFDEDGNAVFDIDEIIFRPLSSSAGNGMRAKDHEDQPAAPILHSLVWAHCPGGLELARQAQPCYLLTDGAGEIDMAQFALETSVKVVHATKDINTNDLGTSAVYYVLPKSTTVVELCASVLDLVKLLADRCPSSGESSSLWIFTHGCQMAPFSNPQDAAVWGLVRSLSLEDLQGVNIGLVDLLGDTDSPGAVMNAISSLVGKMPAPKRSSQEWAWNVSQNTWYSPRLVTDHTTELEAPTMAVSERGFDTLQAVPIPGFDSNLARELDSESVLVRVGAVGINFHDVVFAACGATSEGAKDGSALGVDFAGVVEAVGARVSHARPGDTVFGMSDGCMRTLLRCHGRLVHKLEPSWNLSVQDAAALPTIFATAYYCLVHLAHVERGQTVLVHTASGGLGHMVVRLAQSLGANVVATAGSDEKRDYVSSEMGVERSMVATSRNAENFSKQLQHLVGQVDVVINTLSGDYIPKSLRLLKPGGKFLETGKLAIWTPEQVASARPDVEYNVVMLTDVELLDRFLVELKEGIASGNVKAPRVESFEYPSQLKAAFEHVRNAQHIGKVVLTMENPRQPATNILLKATQEADIVSQFVVPDVPVTFDQPRYEEAMSKVSQLAARGILSAVRNLQRDEVDPRWLKLFDMYYEVNQQQSSKGDAPSSDDLSVDSIARHWPEAEPEARVVGLTQGNIEDLFRGSIDAPALLSSQEATKTVEAFYEQSCALTYYNTVLKETLTQLTRERPSMSGGSESSRPTRRLRVLEVGADNGATTGKLLPWLIDVGFEVDYVLTNVSDVSLKKAKKAHASDIRLGRSKVHVEYGILDMEIDPALQGFQLGQFDIVLANCVHATRVLTETMSHIRALLRPAGALILFEPTRKSAIMDCIFGFTDDWWRFEDSDLRPDYPLISFGSWESLLAGSGFVNVKRADSLKGDLESFAVIMARNAGGDVADTAQEEKQSVAVCKGATYLVTGGNSGLGLVSARVLLDAGAENVVLLSRSGVVQETDTQLFNQVVHVASRAGSTLKHLVCDVGDAAALERTLSSLESEGLPPVRGVVHAAGLLRDASFREQTVSSLEAVIKPKIQGAINLVQLLHEKKASSVSNPGLDFLLLFSSMAGLLGSVEQTNYGAANAALDSMAAQWRGKGLHVMSVAWGMVIGLGTLARRPISRALVDRLGVVSPDLAYRTIRASIALASSPCPDAYRAVAPIQWHKLLGLNDGENRALFAAYHGALLLQQQLESRKRPTAPRTRSKISPVEAKLSSSSFKRGQKLMGSGRVPSLVSVESTIREVLSDVAAVDVPEGSSDALLDDFGMDSLSSMELGRRLNAAFSGLNLSPLAMHTFPTLGALAQHIHAQLSTAGALKTSKSSKDNHVGSRDTETVQHQTLVELNHVEDDGHPDTPFGIVIHGGAGEVHHTKVLAEKLPFKIWGIRQTEATPSNSIASMAAHYIDVLDRAGILGSRDSGSARKRLQLMGYSFGGAVAWEMSRMLEMDGPSKPERLLLLDGGPGSDVSMQAALGANVSMQVDDETQSEEDAVGPQGMRLMGTLLFASGAKVISRAELVSTLEDLGLTGSQGGQLPDVDAIKRTTQDVVARIPESLRGEPLRWVRDLFVANCGSYDRYMAFWRAGRVPSYDGPVWIARSRLPRDEDERKRANIWLDSDHYEFLGLDELAGAIQELAGF